MARQALDEGKRQFGQRAHIEIDHGELLGAVERGGRAGEPEAGIVDDVLRLEAARGEFGGERGGRFAPAEIAGKHSRPRPADAAISSARASRRSSRRATRTSSCPCAAKTRASSAPMPAEAPVISVTGVMHRRRSLSSPPMRLAQLDPLARRDAKQVGGAPQQIVLELVASAVGIDDLPHHFDDAGAARLVEHAIEQTG